MHAQLHKGEEMCNMNAHRRNNLQLIALNVHEHFKYMATQAASLRPKKMPPMLKSLSTGADVAGMVKYFAAMFTRYGNLCLLSFQNCRGLDFSSAHPSHKNVVSSCLTGFPENSCFFSCRHELKRSLSSAFSNGCELLSSSTQDTLLAALSTTFCFSSILYSSLTQRILNLWRRIAALMYALSVL